MKFFHRALLSVVIALLTTLPAAAAKLNNPLGDVNDVNSLLVNVIKSVLGIVGVVTLAVFVYGGFMMLISRGSPAQLKKGTDALFWATVGLVIVFASYGLTQSLFKVIAGKGI